MGGSGKCPAAVASNSSFFGGFYRREPAQDGPILRAVMWGFIVIIYRHEPLRPACEVPSRLPQMEEGGAVGGPVICKIAKGGITPYRTWGRVTFSYPF